MEFSLINNSLVFARRVLDARTSTTPIIRTTPDKPAFSDAPIRSPFPRATPESMGVPSSLLSEYFRALRDDKSLDMHSLTVARGGAVIAEADFGAYDRRIWHSSFSECKSVVSLAIGMLLGEGKLDIDDSIVKLLADRAPKLAQLMMKDITVRHLLAMTSGVSFNEAGAVTETDWVRGFFDSKLNSSPGERFRYNSMNTYMLSVIVREVSGLPLTEYLRPRLWEPLGIEKVFWEKCPMGIEKGGWGLYMRQEDFLKIGQLVLNGGQWEGRQLVPESWIKAATTAQSLAPESYGDYNYGYQMWVGRRQHSFLFNGMFGQNVFGWPETGLLVATNGGVEDVYQASSLFSITQDMLGGELSAGPLPEDPAAHAELLSLLASLSARSAEVRRPPERALLGGRSYRVTTPNAPSTGLFPLSMQSTQNIPTKGILSLGFLLEGDTLIMRVRELDEAYNVRIGFGAPEYSELNFHGEPHRVGTTARFGRDEDGRLVLVMRVSFLEATAARHIRLYFEEDMKSLSARWSETPGYVYLTRHLALAMGDKKPPVRKGGILGRDDYDYINYKMESALNVKFKAGLE